MDERALSLIEALVRTHASSEAETAPPLPPFTIAISREVGSMGNSVATEIGRRLDWPVYDRNILDKIAERLHHPPSHLHDIDEHNRSLLGECFSSLLDHDHFVSSGAYYKHLLAAVHGLGATGHCVIVGRGANFILAPESTLRVRMVAKAEDRARVAAERLTLSSAEAAAYIETAELHRIAFLKQHFDKNPADPHHYDLMLNMSRFSVNEAAEIVIETLHRLENHREQAKRGEAQSRKEVVREASPVFT